MILLATQGALAALSLFGFTQAIFGYNLYNTDTTLMAKDVNANYLNIPHHDVTLTVVNAANIIVRDLYNWGTMVFKTNDFTLPTQNSLEYTFGRYFVNGGTFVIKHEHSYLPIRVRMTSSITKYYFLFPRLSGNVGDFIFLSNGPARDYDEFVLKLQQPFHNTRTMAFLGTREHQVRVRFEAKAGAPWLQDDPYLRPEICNERYMFLKNAAFHQAANFTRDCGCIALGENSLFVANTTFRMGLQILVFSPGAGRATLFINSGGSNRDSYYEVANFPRGSEIKFDRDFLRMSYFFTHLRFHAIKGEGDVTIQFNDISIDENKFRFENRVLTYEEDALNRADNILNCESVYSAMERALSHEIQVQSRG